jgi:hypothetical protein
MPHWKGRVIHSAENTSFKKIPPDMGKKEPDLATYRGIVILSTYPQALLPILFIILII